MTLDFSEKLGQLFFVGFEGLTLTRETRKFLETIQPGGIIFFKCNIKDKKQVKNLIKEINECLKIKPFIAVDQEGGRVERLRKICTSTPSVWSLAKVGLKKLLQAQSIIAKELKELGFNMNFAPVLDINSNPKNPIIGARARSISSNPTIVSEYGNKIAILLLKNEIIPVVKHFPGHGGVDSDSHRDLPVLSKTLDELNNFELLPFKKAIKNKVPFIMVGHIQVSALEKDKKKPATLSKSVIEKLLRKKLNYKGLVITDELNMKGITKNYSLKEAAYKAIFAGVDMLLFNYNEKKTLEAFECIRKRSIKDKVLIKRIKKSYEKIKQTKKKLKLLRER